MPKIFRHLPTLRSGHRTIQLPPEQAILVIFGITGDLAKRMLLPALYHLVKDGLLHEHTVIIGVSRHKQSVAELLSQVELCVLEADKTCDSSVLAEFHRRLQTLQLDPVQGADYSKLLEALNAIEAKHGMCMNRLYYLAIPPQVYEPVIEKLGEHGLNTGCPHNRGVSRLLVEKPFGYDLTSAKELVAHTAKYFAEDQVFRIDHYLAKEMAQNILTFRAENPLFTSAWDNHHVSQIELLFSEQIGVEGRAAFYDNVGALRDVVQNHLMQLLMLTTMELPASLQNEAAIHRAKRNLLTSIKPVDIRKFPPVRGQYIGYQEEVKNPGSTTETYVKLQLEITNARWRGVPITLTAGKALAEKEKSVTLTFTDKSNTASRNQLTFRISPNEGIGVQLIAKSPGFDQKTQTVTMDFNYETAFGSASHPDAYERVLVDAVRGDHALFASSREVLESWRILQPILTYWERGNDDLLQYEPGSDNPTTSSIA